MHDVPPQARRPEAGPNPQLQYKSSYASDKPPWIERGLKPATTFRSNIDPKYGTLIPKCSRGLQPAFISPSTRWWRAKNILQRLAALGARELQRFNVLRSPCEGASNFPGARKQLRILDCDFVIDRVLVNDREAFDGMQIFAQIRYFPRIRHAAVEIGGVHDECVSFPMANGITHEQPDIFAKMFPSVQVDRPARVVVIVQDHNLPGRLKDRIRVVAIFTLEETRQRAPRIQFDVPQVLRGIHIQEVLPPSRVFFGPPRKLFVCREDNAGRPLYARLLAA